MSIHFENNSETPTAQTWKQSLIAQDANLGRSQVIEKLYGKVEYVSGGNECAYKLH